jgi:hypothetical protein
MLDDIKSVVYVVVDCTSCVTGPVCFIPCDLLLGYEPTQPRCHVALRIYSTPTTMTRSDLFNRSAEWERKSSSQEVVEGALKTDSVLLG